jgi:alkylation response protein AidB-like acyl-CoA dehydrogenase
MRASASHDVIFEDTAVHAIVGCERAVALIGSPSQTMHHPLQRHFRDALCARVNAPQEDFVLLAAGRAGLAEVDGGR